MSVVFKTFNLIKCNLSCEHEFLIEKREAERLWSEIENQNYTQQIILIYILKLALETQRVDLKWLKKNWNSNKNYMYDSDDASILAFIICISQ